ncbi:DUF4834 family protein [Pseudoflavitalea sp. X16]|uniref:DUF4834 family protein n=1 Tax=Paraflavitalea devenefica TaxID=2716334 RepID=UPI001423D175|nr:DUF4834 family protein [Paraflavitalea devenefica]NII24272.1 DUF4834 family protein [Paraflavitalea devenefica]
MLRVFLWILLGYFLYRFVFNFLVPIFRVSRQMKQQVRDFQNHMQAQQQQHQQQQSYQHSNTAQRQQAPSSTSSHSPQEKSGDYIDFEEVK